MDSMLVSFADRHSVHDRRDVERRLAQALSGLSAPVETVPATFIDEDLSSRELLQRAWDRAEEEIEALQTELRLLRQRHQDAERQLLARIHQRKRLQQTILDSAGETATAA
jgi:bacterioferritin (cytochrome b1)